MKPRLLYHPRTIGQSIRFALLGIRAAMSAIQWLFLRVDEAQIAAHNDGNDDEYLAASDDLAWVRQAMLDLQSARTSVLTLRAAFRRAGQLDRGAGVPIATSGELRREDEHPRD